MKAGPKRAIDDSPLRWRPRSTGSARFAAFCQRFIRVPKGAGALSPLVLRAWQRALVGSVLDADPQPRIAGWALRRGQGKSTPWSPRWASTNSCVAGRVPRSLVAAVDERQAMIVFGIAHRMVEIVSRTATLRRLGMSDDEIAEELGNVQRDARLGGDIGTGRFMTDRTDR
jgi:hypothetical protein